MPYRRNYRRRRYNRSNYRRTKAIARAEVKKASMKAHPLRWIDVNYFADGDYITTTPTIVSFGDAVRDYYAANPDFMDDWLDRNDPTGIGKYKEAKIKLTGVQYQLRWQQNGNAVPDPINDTVRALMYSHIDTWDENTEGLLAGGDIDQAPNTKDVLSMYFDRLFYLKASKTGTDDWVPDQKYTKGFKRLNKVYDMTYVPGTGVTWKEGDVRLEMQSDDTTVGIGEVQVYGFLRIYWRVV